MRGFELVKREDHWALYNEDGHKIAATIPGCNSKLSIKNCEAIANGYDLDELAEDYAINQLANPNEYEHSIYASTIQNTYMVGFQKALEILGDKKFSVADMLKAIAFGWDYEGRSKEEMLEIHNVNLEYNNSYSEDTQKYLQSLQQTEWDVEIVTEKDCYSSAGRCDTLTMADCIICTPVTYLQDADNCLILKRI